MLIDIFARRYEGTPLRDSLEPRDSRLLVQAFRILSEDICPYYNKQGNKSYNGEVFWKEIHDQLSRELGLKELSPEWVAYRLGNGQVQSHQIPIVTVCENWINSPVVGSPDVHIKERLSLVELGFRKRDEAIAAANASAISSLEKAFVSLTDIHSRVSGDLSAGAQKLREAEAAAFRDSVTELNARFRQASYPLNYHNGFIQISTDNLVQQKVETPFWSTVSGPIWKNVDQDMKEALDLRDTAGRDPAFYAARALESAIKIISDQKGWTHGKERGAHNYIDNLASRANGFIAPWESTSLKEFFTHVRNPFGHGAGSDQMPVLSDQQTEWAIEFSMSWIKNLIRRL